MSRYSDAIKILGPRVHDTIRATPVLVVGAGGIGSELLKNMVLVGFENITIVDLDTIDLSNLNRQFLFRKPDISKPKASVAAATARHFNPKCTIVPRHANIKDDEFDSRWFSQFGLVFGALDNMDARRHVNKMCVTANVPLIESGTAGFAGQVQPIIPGKTSCYDCKAKAVPKTFPVCTIRATPSTPIHCIVWAKSYLFVQLFGEDDETTDQEELNKAAADGENAGEIENLKKEAAAFRAVRKAMSEEGGARRVFNKVFNEDINRLLQMKDMWTVPGRVKPTPLDYDAIMDGSFVLPPTRQAVAAPTAVAVDRNAPEKAKDQSGLKDQQELSLKDNLLLFTSRCEALAERLKQDPTTPLAFDKDDDETLDFVCATSNLRSFAYGIQPQTRFKVKEMAGNIIPAIATTNAIIAGMVVFQAIRILGKRLSTIREPNLQRSAKEPIISYVAAPPSPACPTSSEAYLILECDPSRLTLGEVLKKVVRSDEGLKYGDDVKLSVYEAGRVLNEPDYGDDDDDRLDNEGKTLAELGCGVGTWVSIVDEEDEEDKYQTLSISLCKLRDTSDPSRTFAFPPTLPTVPKVPQPPKPEPEQPVAAPAPSLSAAALAADSDDEIELLDDAPPAAEATGTEPNAIVGKKRTLSEDPGAAPSAPASKKRRGHDLDVNDEGQIEIDMSDEE